jgi:hypothetical protein
MNDAAYLSAVKDASAGGWRRREPIQLATEQPRTLARLLSLPAAEETRASLPTSVVESLVAAAAL